MAWRRRIERARVLAEQSPVLPELLDFYGQIARFQSSVAEGMLPANLELLLALIRRTAPDPMSQPLQSGVTWDDRLRGADPMHAFFARVLLQANGPSPSLAVPGVQPRCPLCAEKPVAAVLRPEGNGGTRFLLCGLCFTEWECPCLLCPNCGEAGSVKLAGYTGQEFPHIHVEACRACRVYLKVIDMAGNGGVVPEVDELASVVLDLWAAERGYTKLQANLFGV